MSIEIRKTITLLAFVGFLIGLLIGAFVAHDQKISKKIDKTYLKK